MKRIRTISGAYDEIRAADPGTAITLTAIRRAVREGDIPSRRVGSRGGWKYFVDIDTVVQYFGGVTDVG